jgi:hypothetical protein
MTCTRRDVLAAWLFLFVADVTSRFAGFRRVHRFVRGIPLRQRRPGPDAAAIIARVNEAIDRAAVWYPRYLRCLPRSIAATWLLRRRCVPATFVIGIRKVPFYAHAWVEVDGRVVNDAASVQLLYPAVDRLMPLEGKA